MKNLDSARLAWRRPITDAERDLIAAYLFVHGDRNDVAEADTYIVTKRRETRLAAEGRV